MLSIFESETVFLLLKLKCMSPWVRGISNLCTLVSCLFPKCILFSVYLVSCLIEMENVEVLQFSEL